MNTNTNTFYLPISQETCDYLQRLSIEREGKLEIINRLFSNHAKDTNDEVLTSIPFKSYEKEFRMVNAEFDLAKRELSNELTPVVQKTSGIENVKFNWEIEDFSVPKVRIDIVQ